MRKNLLTVLVTASTLIAAGQAGAQSDDFQWSGRIASGKTLEVRGVNGGLRAVASDGEEAVVEANREGPSGSDPNEVRIEVVEHVGGVTICAVYPTPPRSDRPNECRPGGGRINVEDNDVTVEFAVRVPAGVKFKANVVNGGIDIQGLRSDVEASTVNGEVRVETTGLATAKTVNGNIEARIGQSRLARELVFETVNGDIELAVPAGLGAELRANTLTGEIETDFPLQAESSSGNRYTGAQNLRGRIGAGGPELDMSTVNGTIRLRRS